MLVSMKSQLARHLYSKKFLRSEDFMADSANRNSANESLVRAVVCAGLYPNVAKETSQEEEGLVVLYCTVYIVLYCSVECRAISYDLNLHELFYETLNTSSVMSP